LSAYEIIKCFAKEVNDDQATATEQRSSAVPRFYLPTTVSERKHYRKPWLRQQPRAFPSAKAWAVGEENLSQQENSAVGKEFFANNPKSKD
jgi:hypothetical protein